MSLKRKVLAGTVAVLVGAASASTAAAASLWDNGGPKESATYCNNSGVTCLSTGWTIYDDFRLTAASTITGLSYSSNFNHYDSSPSNYENTNWSIWSADPRTNFASGPLFSGVSTGVNSTDSLGFTLTTISGLKIALAEGTYWLGLQNNTSGNSISTYVTSVGSKLGQASQSDDVGHFFNPDLHDASFALQGFEGVSAVPEPSTWAIMIVGMGLAGAAIRGRRRTSGALA